MENDKIIFRTPEIPKNRRRKSLPYKIDGEHQASPLSSLSASYSFAYGSGSSLNSSANESTSMYDTSLNSSIDDYLEIENITRSLDLTTLTFDDEKRQKVSVDNFNTCVSVTFICTSFSKNKKKPDSMKCAVKTRSSPIASPTCSRSVKLIFITST